MGVIAEEGVLKLVHPGRYVEVHQKPLLAADVMKKNPRHCITRPDVFQNPSIVVKPDSVLTPGKVFFIVPNITLYKLLKSRGLHKQATQQQCQSNKYGGRTGMHKSQTRSLKHLLRVSRDYDQKDLQIMAWNEAGSCIQDYGSRCIMLSKVQSRPEVVEMNKDTNLGFKERSVAIRGFQTRASDYENENFCGSNSLAELRTKIDNDLEFDGIEEATAIHFRSRKPEGVTTLKSCLRKPDSLRKSLPLRVSFVLDEEQQRRLPVSQNRI